MSEVWKDRKKGFSVGGHLALIPSKEQLSKVEKAAEEDELVRPLPRA